MIGYRVVRRLTMRSAINYSAIQLQGYLVPEKTDSIVSDLKSLIPGFGSYRTLESRREDDRLTRDFLVKRIQECKSRLDSIGTKAAADGDLETPIKIDKYRNELDRARSRLAAAVEGYSNWFSKRTVDEKLLDQVCQQDSNLASVVDLIGELIQQSPLPTQQLKETIDLLHQRIDRRGELLRQI